MNSRIKKISILLLLFIIPNSTLVGQIQVEKLVRKPLKWLKKMGMKGGKWTLEDAVVHPDYQVMGIEPTWCVPLNKYENYYFNAVSTVVVGQYDINPETGLTRHYPSLMNPLFGHKIEKQNEKISFVSQAKKLNPNIHVNIALFFQGTYDPVNDRDQYDFLQGETFVGNNSKGDFRHHIVDTLNMVFERLYNDYNIDYDHSGVLVNIEDVPIDRKKGIDKSKAYFSFINFLIERLDHHEINLKIPRSFYSQPELKTEFEKIEDKINSFIIQAYDDYPKASNPVNMDRVEMMISITENLGIPKEKIIIELPNFGNKVKGNKSEPVYLDEIRRTTGTSPELTHNREKDSATFVDPIDSTQYFFDDVIAFDNKIKRIKEQGVNGIAMYGLGYNTVEAEPFFTSLKENKFLKKKESLYLFMGGFIAMFLPLGMIYSIFNSWETRNALAKYSRLSRTFWGVFILFIIVALLLFFAGNIFVFILGAVVVAGFLIRRLMRKAMGKLKKVLRYRKYLGV